MTSNSSQVLNISLSEIKLYKHQLRQTGKKQIEKTIRLIQEIGFPPVVLVNKDLEIITGQFLVEAARQMELETIPIIRADNLDDKATRLIRLGLDRLRDEEQWVKEALSVEIQELQIDYPDLDLTLTGFEIAELDCYLDFDELNDEDPIPEADKENPPITKKGDLWQLGEHRLYCGDSLRKKSYTALMNKRKARMILSDPPYNVPIDGHVCGNGKVKHREFENASGEMSEKEFTTFLEHTFKHMISFSENGSLHYIFMDWRHGLEMMLAAKNVNYQHKNTCIWVKDNGGMGSFYRSRHEMIYIFKNGDGPYINNIELGKHGRYRTNVWEYAGVNSFAGQQSDLSLHPTVKPVALLMDAIKDCDETKE